jgi:uncharacterized membrane protein
MAQTASQRRKSGSSGNGAKGTARRGKNGARSNGKSAAQTAQSRKRPTQSARGKAAAAEKRTVLAAKKTGGKATRAAKRAKPDSKPKASKLKPKSLVMAGLRKAALKAVKVAGAKALSAAAETARAAAGRAVATGRNALNASADRRLPIFASIDVAVPPMVAWEQWMTFESFTEGVHRIEDVERDGDRLYGRTPEPMASDWEAEIVDEREQQAFAWRSVEGSDCAGLATFHQLSDRLTRIELDLDVLPTNPAETLALSLHIAHKRAETELRRFKARVEFINPDVYEAELSQNGSEPDAADDDAPDNDD